MIKHVASISRLSQIHKETLIPLRRCILYVISHTLRPPSKTPNTDNKMLCMVVSINSSNICAKWKCHVTCHMLVKTQILASTYLFDCVFITVFSCWIAWDNLLPLCECKTWLLFVCLTTTYRLTRHVSPLWIKTYPVGLSNVLDAILFISLYWGHNEHDSVSNHQPHDCLLKRLFKCRSKKYQSSASLAFVRGIHRGPVNSPHKGPVTRKMFTFDDVIIAYSTDTSAWFLW